MSNTLNLHLSVFVFSLFFFQAEDGIRVGHVTGVQTCALPIFTADALSYGQKRILEILRALATKCEYLLLDEPAAGLNEEESEHLLSQLSEIPAKFDCGLLIIDHDMNLIMRLCERLHVLNQGKTISEGDPEHVRSDPTVVEAYLGSQASAGVVPTEPTENDE